MCLSHSQTEPVSPLCTVQRCLFEDKKMGGAMESKAVLSAL